MTDSIKIGCPQCGQHYGINERIAGRKTRCPACDAEILVPSLEQIEASRRSRTKEKQPTVAAASAGDRPASPRPPQAAVPPPPPKASQDEEFVPLPIGKKGKRVETEMDLTPMVDVTFLLLIFFVVTAAFSRQQSIALPPQKSDAPSSTPIEQEQDELDQVSMQINEFGVFMVLAADWEREVAGKPSLIATLREARSSLGGQVRLAIECHEAAELRFLVDAMDAGAICEYTELQVTQVDGF